MKNLLIVASLFSSITLMAQGDVKFISRPALFSTDNYTNETTGIVSESTPEKPIEKKITYKDHIFEAESFDIPLIETNSDLDSLINENKLIEVPNEGKNYMIQKLTHSRAFLNPQANVMLNIIADKFFGETNKMLSISSLTRTHENQRKLTRVNSNATKGHSAHSFGAAFDISYSRYGETAGRSSANEKVLEAILNQLVEEGKIYYIKERRQPCYHITVRNIDNTSF